MADGSSPGTSEIRRLTTLAGCAAAASRPPLIAERCFRTTFIWAMSAPLARSARFTACLSSSVNPGAGSASRADPPPDQEEDKIIRPGLLGELQDALGRGTAWSIWNRVCCLDDLDPPTGYGVTVARDDEAFERRRPVLLDRLGHRGRRLSATKYDGAALGWRGEVLRHDVLRPGRLDRGVEHGSQQVLRRSSHGVGPPVSSGRIRHAQPYR